jgi:hypothetical protein
LDFAFVREGIDSASQVDDGFFQEGREPEPQLRIRQLVFRDVDYERLQRGRERCDALLRSANASTEKERKNKSTTHT